MAGRDQLLNDAEEAFRIAFEGKQSQMWTACPGIVTAVDFTNMVLSIQPAIKGVIEDENGAKTYVALPLLINVPIVYPSAGGFTITFPIAVDDEVLVIFASRCIDSWWQSSGIQKPMEARMHDLSDGFAIPGPRSVPRAVPGISATDVQIRNDAGTTYIGITTTGKIKMVATGDVEITGNLKATGEITAKSATVPVNLSAHHHTGVTTGAGVTGGPVG